MTQSAIYHESRKNTGVFGTDEPILMTGTRSTCYGSFACHHQCPVPCHSLFLEETSILSPIFTQPTSAYNLAPISTLPLKWTSWHIISIFASDSGLCLLASAPINMGRRCPAHILCLEPTKTRLVLVCPLSGRGGLDTQSPRLATGGQIPKLCPRNSAKAEELSQI